MGDLTVNADNTREFETSMPKTIAAALESIGLVAEGYAKTACPVDTGRLRNSITHVVDSGEQAVYIGTNVEYAPCVELGTHTQKAQPYLRPAAADHSAQYREMLKQALGG